MFCYHGNVNFKKYFFSNMRIANFFIQTLKVLFIYTFAEEG